jgi:hypothetical protein
MQGENCETIMQNAWKLSMNVRSSTVTSAMGDVAADLWDWSKNILGGLEKRIKCGPQDSGRGGYKGRS